MKRVMILALIATVLSLAAGIAPSQRSSVAQSSDVSGAYIALGDSIAYGVGSSLPERRSYPSLVRDFLDVAKGQDTPHVNLAVPGETASSFLTAGQFDAFVQEKGRFDEAGIPIDVVTVSLGGNEMLAEQYSDTEGRQAALDDFRENFDRAMAQIRDVTGPDTIIVATTYYDLSDGDASLPLTDAWWIAEFNGVIQQASEREGGVVADLNDAFRSRIDEYTYNPYDVHPNNQGYRAIARQVWRALALDQEPPAVEVESDPAVTRRLPTLQLLITENVDVARVSVTLNDGPVLTPVSLGEGQYVLLLDLRIDDEEEYSLLINAEDSAGNASQIEHRIVLQAD